MTRTRIAIVVVLALTPLVMLAPINDTPPDWTIAPCVLWSTDTAPILPPYTRTDVCVTDIGTLSFATN